MQIFPVHTAETAPEQSRPALEGLERTLGFIPNAAATMAGSPALLNAFVASFGSFHGGSLTEAEKQVVLLTNAVTLDCHWTTLFHSAVAERSGVSAQDIAAIRARRLPAVSRLAALSALARTLIERKGHGIEREIAGIVSAGFGGEVALEVIAAVAISTMAGLTANMANTPVEPRFREVA